MRILGIDPGYALVGCGIVDYNQNKFNIVGYGCIRTEAGTPFPLRLVAIYKEINELIEKYKPEAVAIEKIFHTKNTKTVIDVSQARGVLILAAQQHGLPITEYTPMQIKQGVVGYGKAEKMQVQEMTRAILKLAQIPKPDDAADALAVAICHAHSQSSLMHKL